MNQPFKIFPSSGYRNTQFQVVGFLDNLKVRIEHEGQVPTLVDLSKDTSTVIKKFDNPGQYTATCTVNGKEFRQTFQIKDAIRLGTSELKAAYTFDEIPFTFFLMRDRMLIYNETEKVQWTENDISPTEIKQIDKKHILFITRIEKSNLKNGITNYGVYSLSSFSIVEELKESFVEIFHDETKNILWLYNSSEKSIVALSLNSIQEGGLKKIKQIDSILNYKLSKYGSHLYAESNDFFSVINLKTTEIKIAEKKNNFAIDEDGNNFQLKDGMIFCNNLESETTTKISCLAPANLNLSTKRFYFIGSEFVKTDSTNEFEIKSNEIADSYLSNLDNTKNYQYIQVDQQTAPSEEELNYELYPTENGIHIVKETIVRILNGVTYRKDIQNNWKAKPNIFTTHTYSLFYNSGQTKKVLIDSSKDFSTIDYFHSVLIIRNDNKNKFILAGQIIREIKSRNEYSVITLRETGSKFLFEKVENNYNVFSFSNFKFPILNEVEIVNLALIEFHSAIWFSVKPNPTNQNLNYLKGYNLVSRNQFVLNNYRIKHSIYNDSKDFFFTPYYFLSSNKVFVHPFNGEIKDAAFGSIINASKGLNKIVTRRADNIYLLNFDSLTNKYSEEIIQINIQKNNESYLSPNGKYLMLQKQPNEYLFYDIEKDEEIKFFSEKFLSFSKEGNLIFEGDDTRAAKIIDPLTFEDITPLNYHHYRFLSPDGKLYSQLSMKVKYYDKIQEREIDQATVIKYRQELDESNSIYLVMDENKKKEQELAKAKIDLNRKKYFENNEAKFIQLGIEDYKKINSFTVVRIDKSTEIGIVGTNQIVEIPFPEDLAYYNYAAFSYDNNYFGYVGKPSMNGFIHLFKLIFNSETNSIAVVDNYLSRYPRYASWVCGFSKSGYFATYDSTPDTYILKVDEELFEQKTSDEDLRKNIFGNSTTIYKSYRKWNEIKGKNFLCFSPSGNFLALSEQGYEPLTLGGYGHQESSVVHLAKTVNGEIVDSFLGHGERIKDDKNKKVVFVAFSENEKKIMSMSADGVVIVRNIELQLDKANTHETLTTEQYASR